MATISFMQALPAGNAIRVYFQPSPGASYSRVLRNTTGTFAGPSDPAAVLVADQVTDSTVTDVSGLVNGTPYFYAVYDYVSSAWSTPAIASATPAATYAGGTIDPLSIVIARLELGLAVEVARAALKPASGRVPVMSAPFMLADKITFPCVSVHLTDTGPSERFVGDEPFADYAATDGSGYIEGAGWLARTTLNVVGVSLNPDERIALRLAIARIIQANMPVFSDLGLMLIEFRQSDSEQLTENAAPLFMTAGTFSCTSPAFVSDEVGLIADVDVTLFPFGMDTQNG